MKNSNSKFILTDIHGCFDTFMALVDKIADKGGYTKKYVISNMIIAGDLIDRGPKSRQIIQWCIDHPEVKVIRGNHEEMMLDEGLKEASYYMRNKMFNYHGGKGVWLMNGGKECLESYIIESKDDFDYNNLVKYFDLETFIAHMDWIKTLPYYVEFKDVKNDKGEHLLVTHSSAAKVWKWDEKRRKEQHKHFIGHLTWGRPHSINPIPDVYNIFGHTPIKNGPRVKSSYANIDTGCFYYGESGYFQLTAIDFPSMEIYQQTNLDIKIQPRGIYGG